MKDQVDIDLQNYYNERERNKDNCECGRDKISKDNMCERCIEEMFEDIAEENREGE